MRKLISTSLNQNVPWYYVLLTYTTALNKILYLTACCSSIYGGPIVLTRQLIISLASEETNFIVFLSLEL